MKISKWNKMPPGRRAGPGLAAMTVLCAGLLQAASAGNVTPANVVAPSQVNLPPVPAKVLRMSEAGMSDDLIAAYIQKSADSYMLDAEQIIYLHDLGVSSAALESLVNHEATTSNVSANQTLNGLPDTQDVPPGGAVVQPISPVNGVAANFYEALAPYGSWLNVPGYGWCWRPTVEVMNPAWQPYCNNGCWLWTDQGWYWNSYYSWGWAPFHYGRWCRYQGYGWVWCPDDVWGPAWVCWRDYPGYCGWAPLPPGASFTVGVGWTLNGLAVNADYDFGLGARCFIFCDYDDFCNRHPFYHFRRDRDAEHFFNHSRMDNDWSLDAHHHFFDRGISRSRIEAATHKRIIPIEVREFPHGDEHPRHFGRPDRLTRSGDSQVIYRPNQDLAAMRHHFQRGTEPDIHPRREHPVHGSNTEHRFGNLPGISSDRRSHWHTAASGFASNRREPNGLDRNHAVVNPGANRLRPAPGYHPDFSGERRSISTWHSAPQWHPTTPFTPPVRPAPGFHDTPGFSRSVPAWHPSATWHSTRAWHPGTSGFHSAPAFHQSPAFQARPTFHSAPAFRSAPIVHSAPAFRPAPFHPAQARTFGGGHFEGARHR